jgi:hypothetical protein
MRLIEKACHAYAYVPCPCFGRQDDKLGAVEALHSLGWDIDTVPSDQRGDTLLVYAAEQCLWRLVNWLLGG